MELLLSVVEDHRWLGLVRDEEGETWKVTLWPGDLNKVWRALVQPATFVSLSDPNLIAVIREEVERVKSLSDLNTTPPPSDQEELVNRLLAEHPEAWEEIQRMIKGAGESSTS